MNKQAQYFENNQIYPSRNEWKALPISGISGRRIGVGPNGDPWVADNSNRLFKTVK